MIPAKKKKMGKKLDTSSSQKVNMYRDDYQNHCLLSSPLLKRVTGNFFSILYINDK